MSFICRFCDSANPDDVQSCKVCGAKREARLYDYVPGGTLPLGIGLLILAGFIFYNSYPPGAKVYLWNKSGGYFYSSATSIVLTTIIPAILGLACICFDIFKRYKG
jgi:hypothetical protein